MRKTITLLLLLAFAVSYPTRSETYYSTRANITTDYFIAKPISDTIFSRIKGKSYKANCTVKRSELRYIRVLHYSFDNTVKTGELICHRDIASDIIAIFKKLYEAHYPIEQIRLIDDFNADDELSMSNNNTSCFNFRNVSGSRKLSAHSQGKAIDINPLYNPCVRHRRNGTVTVEPSKGKAYTNRSKNFKYKIDHNDLAYKLFIQHGFKWGGAWRSIKDYQHFEKE